MRLIGRCVIARLNATSIRIQIPLDGAQKDIDLLRPILPGDILAIKLDSQQITDLIAFLQMQGFREELRRRPPRKLLPSTAPKGARARVPRGKHVSFGCVCPCHDHDCVCVYPRYLVMAPHITCSRT